VRYFKETEASDPAWRNSGRKLQVRAEVTYKISAFLDVNGIFSRDLRSKQEITVNSAFDWNAMKPAFGEKSGQVLFCCCVPRGLVSLSASFDRAAYSSGETAHIKAAINNQSEQDVKHMVVKLMRFINLRDKNGYTKQLSDVVFKANYPGVGKMSQATRDLPLPLLSNNSNIMPGTKAKIVQISYRFDVECDLFCAPDIEVHLPMIIFAPKPATWGLAALGLQVPQGISFNFPAATAPLVVVQQPQVQMIAAIQQTSATQ